MVVDGGRGERSELVEVMHRRERERTDAREGSGVAFYGRAMVHHGLGTRAAATMALVAKGASEEGSAVLMGMVHRVGEVEEERSELGAGPVLEQRVTELGGALSTCGTGRGERGRRGPTKCRVADAEVVLLVRGGEPRSSEALGRERLQCLAAL